MTISINTVVVVSSPSPPLCDTRMPKFFSPFSPPFCWGHKTKTKKRKKKKSQHRGEEPRKKREKKRKKWKRKKEASTHRRRPKGATQQLNHISYLIKAFDYNTRAAINTLLKRSNFPSFFAQRFLTNDHDTLKGNKSTVAHSFHPPTHHQRKTQATHALHQAAHKKQEQYLQQSAYSTQGPPSAVHIKQI